MILGLDETASMLHEKFGCRNTPEQMLDTAMTAVSALAQPTALNGLLRSLRASTRAVSSCAALSYHHPLGFDKLALIDAEPEFMLRLHAWWPSRTGAMEHVHNHRFAFATRIIRGSYEMRLYRTAKKGIPMVRYREGMGPGATDWNLKQRAAAQLQLISSVQLSEGAGYALPASTLHRLAVAPGAFCITLFLETRIVRSTTKVFTESGQRPPAHTAKQPLGKEGYLERLDAVLEALGDRLGGGTA